MDARAASGAASNADEVFGFEDPEGFPQRRSGNAKSLHEDGFGGERISFAKITPNDLPSQLAGHELACLGHAHAIHDRHHWHLRMLLPLRQWYGRIPTVRLRCALRRVASVEYSPERGSRIRHFIQ